MNIRRRAFFMIFAGMLAMITIGTLSLYRFIVENQKNEYIEKYVTVSNLVSEQIRESEKITNIVLFNGLKSIGKRIKAGKYDKSTLANLSKDAHFSHLFVIAKNGKFIGSSNESPEKIPNLFSFSPKYRMLLRNRNLPYLVTPIIPPNPEVIPYKFMTIRCPNDECLLEAGLRIDFIGNVIDKTTMIDPEILAIKIVAPDGVDLGDMKHNVNSYSRQTLRFKEGNENVIAEDPSKMTIGKKIEFIEENCAQCFSVSGSHFYHFQMSVSKSKLNAVISAIRRKFILGVALMVVLSLLLAFFSSKKLVAGIEDLTGQISKIIARKEYNDRLKIKTENELGNLSANFNILMDELELHKANALEFEKQALFTKFATQVSHDIRSPLSALNLVIGTIQELPEEHRLILRNATQRINDIANGLLQKQKINTNVDSNVYTGPTRQSSEPSMIVTLLDSLISEKRVEFRDKMDIEIQGKLESGYGLFALIDAIEFSRAVSNIINNSVEALGEQGIITISAVESVGSIAVSITDNGKGIEEGLLERIGHYGVSFGKSGAYSGHGLGISQAKNAVEKAGGRLKIQSQPGCGTTVTFVLPRSKTPTWFVESLGLRENSVIVSVDDDQTIHQIWQSRLLALGITSKNHVKLSTLNQLNAFARSNVLPDVIYLVDFEFLGQSLNGLDSIESLGICTNAILVTSRFEEVAVLNRAKSLGIKVLPKCLAALVPLRINEPTYGEHVATV